MVKKNYGVNKEPCFLIKIIPVYSSTQCPPAYMTVAKFNNSTIHDVKRGIPILKRGFKRSEIKL